MNPPTASQQLSEIIAKVLVFLPVLVLVLGGVGNAK